MLHFDSDMFALGSKSLSECNLMINEINLEENIIFKRSENGVLIQNINNNYIYVNGTRNTNVLYYKGYCTDFSNNMISPEGNRYSADWH